MWLKAILGGRRYRVRFDTELPNPGAISAGGQHLLVLNPAAWSEAIYDKWLLQREHLHPVPFCIENWETWSWLCCKAVGAHEVGHARFSGTPPKDRMLARVVNALEDQRVEYGMAARYPVLTPYFQLVGDAQWADLDPIPERDTNTPFAVLQACLIYRWEHDVPAMHEVTDRARSS